MALQLHIPTIVCEGCADTITKAIQGVDATATVAIDLASKQVNIETQAELTTLQAAIVATGHTISNSEPS